MNHCLLCEQPMQPLPSWNGLFGNESKEVICEICSNSFERADIIDTETISLFSYNGAAREFLHQFKFLQDIALADVFAKEIKTALKGKPDIVPIPMHPDKKKERTFAHVDELLKSARIPFVHLLEKLDTSAMGEKTREQRLATSPLFTIKPNCEIPKIVWLADDIITTGTTLKHATAVLKEAGALEVNTFTLFQAIHESR